MALNEQTRNDLVALYFAKAQETIEEAQVAAKLQKWNMAANRIYYAMFHAVSALLVKDEHPVGTHRGAKAALGQYYVVPGSISVDDGRFFAQMETLRDKADYDIVFSATQEDIERYLPKAEKFIERIAKMLEIL